MKLMRRKRLKFAIMSTKEEEFPQKEKLLTSDSKRNKKLHMKKFAKRFKFMENTVKNMRRGATKYPKNQATTFQR